MSLLSSLTVVFSLGCFVVVESLVFLVFLEEHRNERKG